MASPASPDLQHIKDILQYETFEGTPFRADIHFSDNPTAGIQWFTGSGEFIQDAVQPSWMTVTWHVVAGDNNNYVKFAGTPDTNGLWSAYTKSGKFIFSVNVIDVPAPTITSTPPEGRKRDLYSYQITASATVGSNVIPASSFVFTVSGTLPLGLGVPSNGLITGFPTTFNEPAGENIVVTATYNFRGAVRSTSVVQTILIRKRPPKITSQDDGDNYLGDTSVTYTAGSPLLTITAADDPETFSGENLPSGLAIDSGGRLVTTGAVAEVIKRPIILVATNSAGSDRVTVFLYMWHHLPPDIYCDANFQLPAPCSDTALVTVPYDFNLNATRFPITAYSASGLPTGLSVVTAPGGIFGITGEISGTIPVPPTGATPVIIFATNAYGTGSGLLNLYVSYPQPTVTNTNLEVIGVVGTAIDTFTITTTNNAGVINTPLIFADLSENLPAGLLLNTATGEITGTPTSRQVTNVIISVSNAGVYPGIDAQTPTEVTITFKIYAGPPKPTSISPAFGSATGGLNVTITGTDFLGGPGAKVLFGTIGNYAQATDVVFVNSTTITAKTPVLTYTEDPVDVVVVNDDGQSGVLQGAFTLVPAGASVADTLRYTSLYTETSPIYGVTTTGGRSARKKRIFGFGTNVEILFYSGIDRDNNKILNVYRKQFGTTSTRHAASDLVFAGILSIQVAPFYLRTDGKLAHLDCYLRSNGKIEMHTRKVDGLAFAENTNKAYASYQATLIKELDPIPNVKLGTEECE